MSRAGVVSSLLFPRQSGVSDPDALPVTIIGQLPHLTQLSWNHVSHKLAPGVNEQMLQRAISELSPSPTDSLSLYLNRATLAALPSKCARHATPSRAHSVTRLVRTLSRSTSELILVVCERGDALACGCAVARAYPLFSRKSGTPTEVTITVEFVIVDGPQLTSHEIELVENAASSVRLAARIVDTPTNEMHTDAFAQEAQAVANEVGAAVTVIRGEELNKRGFGGIYGVGKAATRPPYLVVLSHCPDGADTNIAWVGKGIVYDTGGLSMKTKTTMPGMKRDLGGAAAVLAAFQVAVKSGFRQNLHAVLCMAENAVGPSATRPDDIHTMYSGRTVEINNTDAEGRLVLADGVSYASKDLKCSIILDMATLTGAQGAATGKVHAAVLCNDGEWEECAVRAGRISADLLHPVPYAPEFHFPEFASSVADMKNSVADRSNALVSCAGLFIGSHLGFDFPGTWIHVDMASPAHVGERATGYGVLLMLVLFGSLSEHELLRLVAPQLPAGLTAGTTSDNNGSKKMRLQ